MTILSILFVMGVAFLASMNFEADMIVGEQQRTRTEVGIDDTLQNVATILRNNMPTIAPDGGFGVDVPDNHSLAAPIEPHRDAGNLVYGWFTDTEWLMTRKHVGNYTGYSVDTLWDSGEPDTSGLPTAALGRDYLFPVDADGDGITDSLAVDTEYLNYSPTQRAELSAVVNDPASTTSRSYVALRTIPHGGLVNLNEAHPLLIQNVLSLRWWPVKQPPPNLGRDVELGFLLHRPTQTADPPPAVQVFYSPLIEEPLLRRRGFLPPRSFSPSLLHGNPFGNLGFDPPGEGDMANQLLWPVGAVFETVAANQHRYWPFSPGEADVAVDPDIPIWSIRMNPFVADLIDPPPPPPDPAPRPEYDRRHLVTTTSHDDLLSRGGMVATPAGTNADIIDAMIDANFVQWDATLLCEDLPFAYPNYPGSIPDGNCDCPGAIRDCPRDARKGNLQLSLPFLDEYYDCASLADPAEFHRCMDERNRLIHDAFLMLVGNASGPFWDTPTDNWCATDADCGDPAVVECRPYTDANGTPYGQCHQRTGGPEPGPVLRGCTSPIDCEPGEFSCVLINDDGGVAVNRQCMDVVMNQPANSSSGTRRQALISRTAASLTANMIDYMDGATCVGGTREGSPCKINSECAPGVCSDGVPTRVALRRTNFADPTQAGRDLTTTSGVPLYVYGLEEQPYITEVATAVSGTAPTEALSAWAIELFNPYDFDITPSGEYFLIPVDDSGTAQPEIPLTHRMEKGKFTALVSGTSGDLGVAIGQSATGQIQRVSGGATLEFRAGWTIYLVRRIPYNDPTGTPVDTDIVVDQIHIGVNTCLVKEGQDRVDAGCLDPRYSLERVVKSQTVNRTVWTATIPRTGEQAGHTLGNYNLRPSGNIHPVEVNFANTGKFARRDPTLPIRLNRLAFPTTGSMLLLMRHANRALSDLDPPLSIDDLAFTTALDDIIAVDDGAGGTVDVQTFDEIDNGRMPVFDRGRTEPPPVGRRTAHHVAPNVTAPSTPRQPGGIENLPWGQLVFDYFTALPLSDPGPYRTAAANSNWDYADGIPRVDRRGLRVHGRIDINAAPWTVLSGLPFVPMERIPEPFRSTIRDELSGLGRLTDPNDPRFIVADDKAAVIGDGLAQAIVAYREARQVAGPAGTSGDYGSNLIGRDWRDRAAGVSRTPAFRRGTGFLTVGELANVRLIGPFVGSGARVDSGVVAVAADGADYVRAIAVLVALGDWVTTRSHVHTIYGTIRGELDPIFPTMRQAVEDVDSRAIRFQETVDRLDTVFGDPSMRRIGPRTISKYRDFHND